MIKEVLARKINCVIVKDLSRFGRDYIETGRYLERIFPEQGVRFISVVDHIDSMKQVYDMLLPIKNIFNEQYAKDISRKIHAVVQTKQKSGEFIGAFTSFGYKKLPSNKNKLIIDDDAAKVVQRIFALYLQGTGKAAIARQLNEEGVPCPSLYKQLNGEKYVNHNRLSSTTYWTYPTIHMILQNEMYVGNMVQGKKRQQMRSRQQRIGKEDWIVVKDTHEAIIDGEIWEKVQLLLHQRTRSLSLGENLNPFAGLLKCGDCGRSMCKNLSYKKDGSKIYRFYCGTYKRAGRQFCTPHTIRYDVVERILLDDLKIILHSIDDLKKLCMEYGVAMGDTRSIADEHSRIRHELTRLERLKKSVYEDFQEGLLSKEEFISYRKDYLEKDELFQRQLQTLKDEDETKVRDIFELPWLQKLIEKRESAVLDRSMLAALVEQITVYENQRIKISYNFSNELTDLFAQ